MRKAAFLVLILSLCLGLSACVPGDPDNTLPETDDTGPVTAETPETTESTTTATTTTEAATMTTTATTTTAAPPENLSPEWVRALPESQDDSARQMIIVAADGMDETTAVVSMHEKDENGYWVQIFEVPGYVGKKGMVYDEDRYEGCGRTPIGRYHFTKAFGIASDPGSRMPYIQVTDDLYWSGDYSMHYNEMVSINDCPGLDKSCSEHLITYTKPYQYCLNISFNEDGTSGRGSAIFLHCYGSNQYTAGCVAIPEDYMIEVLRLAETDCIVVIDLADSLGSR